MPVEKPLVNALHDLVREGFRAGENAAPKAESSPAWKAVRETGTRLWLDTGDLDQAAELWTAEFEALTTNNTLLNKEVQKGLYDDLVRRTDEVLTQVAPDISESQRLLEIAFVLNARHALRLVERFDAYVSVELHTDLAHDVDRTLAYGLRYHAICPERFIVKVPLTPAGLVGARRLSEAGVPVNFTLGFSARQNVLVAQVARTDYANVFMGRLNAFVADNGLGDGKNVGEKATLATQRELLTLRNNEKTRTCLIGASMRDGSQVGTLAGLDVFTMPPAVTEQYSKDPLPDVASRVEDDPVVTTSTGVDPKSFAASTLWEVPDGFKTVAREIGRGDPNLLTPESIIDRLSEAGFGDLFPAWSDEDIQAAARDGKIPVYAHWDKRLAEGRIGLDSLMNLSAFQSFASDQAAMDSRIREQRKG